jgi:hypothetical protein
MVFRYLDGLHHYDEICTTFGYSSKQLDEVLCNETNVKSIWR